MFRKIKILEKRICELEALCEKLKCNLPNDQQKTITEKTQNHTKLQKNWNIVVDEWLNGETKN